jgi:uncharacterized protein
MRIVLDPCVLIAAAISPGGTGARLLAACQGWGPVPVVSPHLLWELRVVLGRPKFRAYLSEQEADLFVKRVSERALLLPDAPARRGVTQDPGDDYLVALARAAGAFYLVSVDHHLTDVLRLRPPVVEPGWLLDRLAGVGLPGAAAYPAISRSAVRSRRTAPALPATSGRQQACVRR